MHHLNLRKIPDVDYKFVKKVRFSCAYLFRIEINGKYLLVKDEQGRNTYQPVGGVYKYTANDFFSFTQAEQCTRLGTDSDLDNDLRIVLPRNRVNAFEKWYHREKGRETVCDLHREFQEEIINRIQSINPKIFETISYVHCGEHTEAEKWGADDINIRIADIVELKPTPEQKKELLRLLEHKNTTYRFATPEEIYDLGRVAGGAQVQTISNHTKKILPSFEKNLIKTKHTGKLYTCTVPQTAEDEDNELWEVLPKADMSQDFTFISYNSEHSKSVWQFCATNASTLNNFWIDRKNVGENWNKDVEKALYASTCRKAIVFIDEDYLKRSTACLVEAKMILERKIPHIIVLVDITRSDVQKQFKQWICDELVEMDKLTVFKNLFAFDIATGINTSTFELNEFCLPRILEAHSNLGTYT